MASDGQTADSCVLEKEETSGCTVYVQGPIGS